MHESRCFPMTLGVALKSCDHQTVPLIGTYHKRSVLFICVSWLNVSVRHRCARGAISSPQRIPAEAVRLRLCGGIALSKDGAVSFSTEQLPSGFLTNAFMWASISQLKRKPAFALGFSFSRNARKAPQDARFIWCREAAEPPQRPWVSTRMTREDSDEHGNGLRWDPSIR